MSDKQIYKVVLKSNKREPLYIQSPSMGAIDRHFRELNDPIWLIAITYGDQSRFKRPFDLVIEEHE